MLPGPAPCGGRFAQPIPHVSQPFLSWLYSAPGGVCRRPSPAVTRYCLLSSLLLCRLCLRPPDVVQQVFQLHPRRLRSFLTSNAALRSRYQGLCPLHPGPLSFALLQSWFTPSAPSFMMSSGSGASFSTILLLTAFRSL